LVLDVRALLGLATRPGVKVDKQWLGEEVHLPALMRCLVSMAWHFQAAGVKGVTLVPLMQRRLIHIELESEAFHVRAGRTLGGLLAWARRRALRP
jgi:hypothetical protein